MIALPKFNKRSSLMIKTSSDPFTEAVRARVRHSVGDATAAAVGMTVAQLQQFVAYSFNPSAEQVADLARHFKMEQPE